MLKSKIASVILLSGLSVGVFAKGPSWDYVDVGYLVVKTDSQASILNDADITGIKVTLSKELSHEFYTDASYDDVEDDNISLKELSVGIGYNHKITNKSDAFVGVGFELEKEKSSGVTREDAGYSVNVGFRNKTFSWLELSTKIKYEKVTDDSQVGLTLGAQFVFTDALSVGVGYDLKENEERAFAGIRYTF